MNFLRLGFCLWACGLSAVAQGTLNFANGSASVRAPVTMAQTGQPLSGPEWEAELWRVETNGTSTRLTAGVPFQSGIGAGYFLGGRVDVPGTARGETCRFRVRVVSTEAAFEGMSEPVDVALGGANFPPANLSGLKAWTVLPVHIDIGVERLPGGQLVLFWAAVFEATMLEFADDLTEKKWQPFDSIAQRVGERWQVIVTPSESQRFFRVRKD